MSLRCPYCHTPPGACPARCRACGASAHPACALELARCAACGDARWDGLAAAGEWGWVAGPGGLTYLRAALHPLAAAPAVPRLRFDVERPVVSAGGLLAGTVWLSLPPAAPRPGLGLVWLLPGRGWLRRRWRPAASIPLLSPRTRSPRPEVGWRHQVSFRSPVPAPGARLAIDLGGRLRLQLPRAPMAGPDPRQVAG